MAVASVLLSLLANAGAAESYTCKDRDGRPLLGNGPPENACERDICITHDGRNSCDPDSSLPPEDATPDGKKEKAHRQWLSDIALLERYPTEARLQQDREAELVPVRKSMEAARQRRQAALVERGALQEEMEFYRGRSVPPGLAERLESNEQARGQAEREIAQGQAEEARIQVKFDESLHRWRELKQGRGAGSGTRP